MPIRFLAAVFISLIALVVYAAPGEAKPVAGETTECDPNKANACKGPTVCTTIRNKGTNGVHRNFCLRPCETMSECPTDAKGFLFSCTNEGSKRYVEKKENRCVAGDFLD